MAQIKTWRCDVCGAEKRSANHWYMVDTTTKTMVIAKWDSETAPDMEFHLCGEGCLSAKVAEVIGEQWRPAPVPNVLEEMACTTK